MYYLKVGNFYVKIMVFFRLSIYVPLAISKILLKKIYEGIKCNKSVLFIQKHVLDEKKS